MSIDAVRALIPDYARDLRINLGNVLDQERAEGMSNEQVWATALATAIASRNAQLTASVEKAAGEHLDEAWMNAAKSAAAIMGMNNIYYRFVHLASNKDYGRMPAGLRMSVIGNPGIDKVDFEQIGRAPGKEKEQRRPRAAARGRK